jgi:plasmid stability protein
VVRSIALFKKNVSNLENYTIMKLRRLRCAEHMESTEDSRDAFVEDVHLEDREGDVTIT